MADAKVLSKNEILVKGDLSQDTPATVRLVTEKDADIPIAIVDIKPGKDTGTYIITSTEKLNPKENYLLSASHGNWEIAPSMIAIFLMVVVTAALISNYVFTKYLGLCVFFGVSRKKETSIGMGITFTIVALISGFLSWAITHFALQPLKLNFLQIIVFIGIIAFLVQLAETVLKKIQPILYKRFGIYLMLITTNCIILAIPLENANLHASFWDSMALALGGGLGFALALFLMSCVRERVEIAPVPAIFKGLPIAFIIAGLFALSFLGFSGLKFM